jgi:hypothetical protein
MAEYIDREAVYKKACRSCTRHGDEFGSCYHEEPCEELQSEFASAPAADVEPVRHGRWITSDFACHYMSRDQCSACCWRSKGYADMTWATWCPSCGAKMEGDEDDG